MKKWTLRATHLVLAACVLLIGFDLSLRWISSSDWMRNWVTQKLSSSLNREVRLEKLSASLLGIKVNGFALSELGGFKEGTFVGVERLRLRISWWHLLHKHVKIRSLAINGVFVQIIKEADGRFNFDSLSSSSSVDTQQNTSSGSSFRVTADRVDLRNVNFAYSQLPDLSLFVHKAAFLAHGVGTDRLFEIRLNATGEYRANGVSAMFPVGLQGSVHLSELNLKNAYAQLAALSVRSGDTALTVQGSAHDFERPQVDMTLDVRRLSSDTLAVFVPDLPTFLIPQMHLVASSFLDLPSSKAEVSSFGLTLPGAQVSGGGTLDYSAAPQYNAHTVFNFNLQELAANAPELLNPYDLSGVINGLADVSNARLTTAVTLQDVGAFVPYAGLFKGLNATVSAEELGDFKNGSAKGKFSSHLNEAPFLMDFNITQTPEKISAVLNASARRVALPPMPEQKQAQPEPEFVTDTNLPPAPKTAWQLPPVDAQVDIQIGSLDAPFFYGTDVAFLADLSGLTPDLKSAQGDLSLRTGNGEIRDLYRLTNANPITKVLFLSLNVVGKVFNSLDVFSVLSGFVDGEDAAQDKAANAETVVKVVTGPDGKPMQIMVPYSSRKMDGHMKYDQFDTAIHFQDGVADMKEGTFVSDTLSFTLSGQTNFKTEKIDMTVQAAPGKHYAGGIMPLKVNIGGTVAEPTGSMSVLGSVSSLVTQGVANNFASNAVKKGVGGLFGLFKKKPAPDSGAAPAAE